KRTSYNFICIKKSISWIRWVFYMTEGLYMIKSITASELQEKIESGEKVNLIDVREEFELLEGKIPGVKNIPLGEIPDRLNELDKNEHYYLICRSGARSGNAC